jgi:hypothetical protein
MSGYLGNIPIPQATQTRDTFTATAGQTSFATSGYTPSFLDVFMNGSHLVNGTDYTATNGSDVVLTSGAADGDVLEVVSHRTFEVNSQNFTGSTTIADLDVTGDFTATDLTLSGGVYLGGTGSANYLDDYEEGTWTPVVADAETGGNTGSWASFTANYIKTGKLVTIFCSANNLDVTGMTSGNTLYITGLPFISDVVALGSVSGRFTGGSEIHQNSFINNSGSYVLIQTQIAGTNEGFKTVGDFSSGGDDIIFTITYTTA